MLSAQRKEIAEDSRKSAQRKEIAEDPKKSGSPYPKDFVRWNALDYFKRPGKFKSRRFWVTLVVTIAVTLLSLASMAAPPLHHVHQAAPVSTAHAMFNQKCSNCHTETFAPLARAVGFAETISIADNTCNGCHHVATHHEKASPGISCVPCHREHKGHELLASHVPSKQCTECHGNLTPHLKPSETTAFFRSISSFNGDHPDFQRSGPGQKDPSSIQFSHKAHLELNLDDLRRVDQDPILQQTKGAAAKLGCIDCHQMDGERRYMQPIRYEQHCARCHQLNVELVGDFASDLKVKATEFSQKPLPHKEPAVVRAVLRDRLIEFAQKNAVVLAKGEPVAVPRPLPWKPTTPVSDEHWTWTMQQARKTEDLLFTNKQWSKKEPLTWCSHCHIEKQKDERVDGLPVYLETAIPSRWHEHSVFSHGAHRSMNCAACHDANVAGIKVADSKIAGDVLLPTIKSCQECHRSKGGARNACVECHRYHDRSQQGNLDGWLELQDVLQKNR